MKPFTILVFIFLLMQLISFTISQSDYIVGYCSDGVDYAANSTYRRNVNTLLSSFSASNITGFFNDSAGDPPNRVNGVVLCRGDASPEICRICVSDATVKILQNCPNQIEAIGYYDFCMLRFTNRSIFGVVNQGTFPPFYMKSPYNLSESELEGFTNLLQSLMGNLSTMAAAGDSRKKFATGSAVSGSNTIFGLMQCTPDLSGQDCENCLVQAVSEIPNYSAGTKGGRVIYPNCNLRYENYQFYEITPLPVAPPPPPPPPISPTTPGSSSSPPEGGKISHIAQNVITIAVPIVSVVIIAILIFILVRGRRKPRPKEAVDDVDTAECLQLDFDTVSVATNNFSDQNKLGQGGFGAVYKGTFPNGVEIAVKRLSKDSQQGDLEFRNEVMLVAKLRHRNLVRLLGFCLEGKERILIYEFVPNASLDHFIFDSRKGKYLDWEKRYKLICGITRGLLYLHEDSQLRIIHRDLKASNILLDEDMNPKIADFGMARLFLMDQTHGDTSRIAGTFGYMAPEYARDGHFSIKTDVFSFGVLLLEIISGQRNNTFRNGEHTENLSSVVWRNWREGTIANIIDPNLKEASSGEIMRCIHIGLLCVQENAANRPTMASIELTLNCFSLTLPLPSQPAFIMHTDLTNRSPNDEIVPASQNDVTITELYGR